MGSVSLDYVGKKACGCYVTWCSETMPIHDLAAIVADWIKHGLSVERKETEWAREHVRRCRCEPRVLPGDPGQVEITFL